MCFLSAQQAAANNVVVTVPVVSVPIAPVAVRQATLRTEFNLAGQASVMTEFSMIQTGEGLGSADQKKNPGESLRMDSGNELTLLFARYSSPGNLAGFYWVLGGGWRQAKTTWTRPINDDTAEYSLTATTRVDGRNRFVSAQESTGNTLHARLGYRYVGSSIPFIIGGQLGVRHFNSHVQDTGNDTTIPLNDTDKTKLRYRLMTAGAMELSLGYLF
jgi:hypothetical protein